MIVQQHLQVCMDQMTPVHFLLGEQFWVTTCFSWANLIQCLEIVELAFRISFPAAVKFL